MQHGCTVGVRRSTNRRRHCHISRQPSHRLLELLVYCRSTPNNLRLQSAVLPSLHPCLLLSNDDCLEDKREDYQNCLCCIVYHNCTQSHAPRVCWFRFFCGFLTRVSLSRVSLVILCNLVVDTSAISCLERLSPK